jgi:chromate transporter
MAIGITRAGLLGGVAAWLGFTLPSAIALVAFAYGVRSLGVADAGWLHGLKVVAVAVVALAVWTMARSLTPDGKRAGLAILAASAALLWPTGLGQITIIAVAALVGWRLFPPRWPARSSKPLYGFAPPPSLSILPAQTFQLIGLRRSAPATRPRHTRTVDTIASTRMSSGNVEDPLG